MKLHEDGTITFEMESATGNGSKAGLEITLRRPRLEELFLMWEAVDKIAGDDEPKARRAKRATTEVGDTIKTKTEAEADPEEESQTVRVLGTMRKNLRWTRQAIAKLGPDGLYEADGDDFKLANAALGEPPWFVNGTLAGQWLRHWQDVPLDLGAAPTP